jgi:eukaryotic-like serine/threonine-protein kinase
MAMLSQPKVTGRDKDGLPKVGDIVAGKYEVERILGVGGMGIVVAARHKQIGELVAIKLLHPDSAMDGEAVARLLREARATISIKSEHVVRVFDVGTLDSGSPYILMEYLTGMDLSELVKKDGFLPVTLAVDYLLQAGEAIAEAHARGIVHRDLKPSNLFLTTRPDGTALVKVLDFGISKALVVEPSQESGETVAAVLDLTATRAVFGSPMYMSPEQVRSAKRVDERTDIWALGVILHELLTGAAPFSGETMPGVLASISADAPEPLRRRRPDAPEGLEGVIAKALVKNVGDRIQSVLELARSLDPFASPEGKLSLARIERLSLPGGVSKRVLPQRNSSVPPAPRSSRPQAELALGSTVRATTTGTTPGQRGSRAGVVLMVVALGAVLAIASATWMLRGRLDQKESAVSSPAPPATPAPPPAVPTTSPLPVASAGALANTATAAAPTAPPPAGDAPDPEASASTLAATPRRVTSPPPSRAPSPLKSALPRPRPSASAALQPKPNPEGALEGR